MTHQATTKLFYRKLETSWRHATAHPRHPDKLIVALFRAAIDDAVRRRRLDGVLTFRHRLFDSGVTFRQRYRVTGFGRVILLPPRILFGAEELPSGIFKV